MNIKLPTQEWLGYDPEKGDLHGYTFEQMREFAELIVLDCVNLLEFHGFDDAVQYVRLHFGVKP